MGVMIPNKVARLLWPTVYICDQTKHLIVSGNVSEK